jgi:hypothetical protein
LERDTLQIVQLIKTTGDNWSNIGHICGWNQRWVAEAEILEHITVKRNANIDAHTIAKQVILCVINRVWIEEISNCISGIIYRERFVIPR